MRLSFFADHDAHHLQLAGRSSSAARWSEQSISQSLAGPLAGRGNRYWPRRGGDPCSSGAPLLGLAGSLPVREGDAERQQRGSGARHTQPHRPKREGRPVRFGSGSAATKALTGFARAESGLCAAGLGRRRDDNHAPSRCVRLSWVMSGLARHTERRRARVFLVNKLW